jgi:hypothetical protein
MKTNGRDLIMLLELSFEGEKRL